MGRQITAKFTLSMLSLVILASVAACTGSTLPSLTSLDLPPTAIPTPLTVDTSSPPQPIESSSPSPTPPTLASANVAEAVQLIVRGIPGGLPRYNRRDWRHWTDADKDCQDARVEVLIEETLVAPTFKAADECKVQSGQWMAPFTGTTVTEASKLDVDHMVPLANAHKSGAWKWDAEKRKAYGNHLEDSYHLIAVTSSANRSKGAKGPDARPLPRSDCPGMSEFPADLRVTHKGNSGPMENSQI